MEFENLGGKCQLSYCKLKDFLPFECDKCKKTFCLEHKEYEKHDCKMQKVGLKKAYTCPLCLQTVKFDYDINENEMQSIHKALNCNKLDYQKVKSNKRRCCNAKCRKILNKINLHQCHNCSQLTCLRHRYKNQHDCQKKYRFKKIINPEKNKPTPKIQKIPMNSGLGK